MRSSIPRVKINSSKISFPQQQELKEFAWIFSVVAYDSELILYEKKHSDLNLNHQTQHGACYIKQEESQNTPENRKIQAKLLCFCCSMPSSFQVKNQAEETSADNYKNKQRELFVCSCNYRFYDFGANEEFQAKSQISREETGST